MRRVRSCDSLVARARRLADSGDFRGASGALFLAARAVLREGRRDAARGLRVAAIALDTGEPLPFPLSADDAERWMRDYDAAVAASAAVEPPEARDE